MSLDPYTATVGVIDTFIGKFVKDKDLAAKLIADANSQEMKGEIDTRLGQLRINEAEAKSGSLFIGGWRPATGWCCTIALAYQFILSPFIRFIALIAMDSPPDFPVLDASQLTPILMGMLGLGGMRTYEKIKQVARS